MLVADASALVDYLLRTPSGLETEGLLTAEGADLQVPSFCDVEVASALRGLILGGEITVQRGGKALAAYLDLPLTRHPHTPLLPRILALRHNLSAYDATYVALAEALRAPLLTTDARLAEAARRHTSVRLAG